MIIDKPQFAIKKAKKLISTYYKEHFIGLYLDTRNKVIYSEVISIGTLNACLVHPREVFSPAIKKRAASIIVLHNHPSGNLEPSQPDIELTRRLKESGRLLGIEVIDHLIFDKGDDFYSLIDGKKAVN